MFSLGVAMFRSRPATAADLETLHQMDRTCFPLTDPQAVRAEPEELRSGIEHGDVMLAEWDRQPAGFLHRTVKPQRIVIEALATLPQFRRRGIARRLMDEVLRSLRDDRPFHLVQTVTSPQNTAMVGLVTSLGFSAGELARDHFGPGKHRLVFRWYSAPPSEVRACDPETLEAVLRDGWRVIGSHTTDDGAHLELSTWPLRDGQLGDSASVGAVLANHHGMPTDGKPPPEALPRLRSANMPPTVASVRKPDARVVRNADAPWDDFNPVAYWKRNYGNLLPIDREILTLTSQYFMGLPSLPGSSAGVRRALDVGTGANLYPALAMLPLVDQITLVDYSPANIDWLRESLDGTAEHWRWESFWQHVSRSAGSTERAQEYRPDRAVRRELAERAHPLRGSIFDLPDRGSWDVGTMFFVAESITEDVAEFNEACSCFFRALRPGAPFAAAFMAGSSGYRVDDELFPAVTVDYAQIKTTLQTRLGRNLLHLRELVPGDDDLVRDVRDNHAFSSMVLALGTVPENPGDEATCSTTRT
jgi:ribosomal protein S18 acetylase RimI-like enzyme